jgi:pimeloyl-ACP methyl ester carboxylesterase
VFVHDWGESRLESLRRVEPWPDVATRLVLYDLRGHGESGGTSRLGRGDERDLLSLLDRLGEGPFVLVGRGLGARIAGAAATRAPRGRVQALVLSLHDRPAGAPVLDRLHRLGCPAALAASALALLRLAGVRPPPAPDRGSLPCPVLETGDADLPAAAERLRELLSREPRAAPR